MKLTPACSQSAFLLQPLTISDIVALATGPARDASGMKNFLRACKFAWNYRLRLAVSVVCALLAAVFWGLNFTAIYPVLKIIGSDKNLQQWVAGEIQRTQAEIDGWQKSVDDLVKKQQELAQAPPSDPREHAMRDLSRGLAQVEGKLEPARRELYRYQVLKKYIDTWVPEDRFKTLALVIGLVVLAVAIKGFFEFSQESLVGDVVNLVLYDIRNRFFRSAIHLDVNNFSADGSHELMARFTNDMELLGNGLKMLFGKVVAEPLRALACVVVACWISWQLTLMFLVLVPVALFILTKVGRTMKRASRRLLERMSSIYKILQESFSGIKVIKAFTREAAERHRFAEATRDYYRKAVWFVKLDAAAGPVIELMGVVTIALALLAGAFLVLNKETKLFGCKMSEQPLEAESLLQLYCLLAAIADPVRKLSSVYTKIQSGAQPATASSISWTGSRASVSTAMVRVCRAIAGISNFVTSVSRMTPVAQSLPASICTSSTARLSRSSGPMAAASRPCWVCYRVSSIRTMVKSS